MTKSRLQNLLDEFEKASVLDETDIYLALKKLEKERIKTVVALDAEIVAFAFLDSSNEYSWDENLKSNFNPYYELPSDNNMLKIFPRPSKITEKMVSYWKKRLGYVKNPVIKARYAGLLWDFYKYITGNHPEIEYAQARIDSIIEIAESNSHKYEQHTILLLKHGLNLALSIRNADRISNVKNAILQYEINFIKGDMVYHEWSISYDQLLCNKKINLSLDEESGIISRIEGRLNNLVQHSPSKYIDVEAIKAAAQRLANYYRKMNNPTKKQQALGKYAAAVIQIAKTDNAIAAQKYLTEAYNIMDQFNQKDLMKKIANILPEIDEAVLNNCQTTSVESKIPKAILKKFINKVTQGTLEDSLKRLTLEYIPTKDKVKKLAVEKAAAHPWTNSIGTGLLGKDGRLTGKIGSYAEDQEGRIIRTMVEYIIYYTQPWRGIGFNAILNEHNVTNKDLINYFSNSIIFKNNLAKEKNLSHVFSYYLQNDPFAFLHTAIPLIENIVRNLLQQKGVDVYQTKKGGGRNLILLDTLLRKDELNNIFNEDISFYFRVVLTDQRGLNLRNDISHGLLPDDYFAMTIADIIFHILLVFAMLQPL